MSAAADAPDTTAQRALAVECFNRAWDLIDTVSRTPEQDRRMLSLAFASRLHWHGIGTEENYAVADWQVAHVASLLGYADVALDFAQAAWDRAERESLPQWMRASTCEGLARAHASAGDLDGFNRYAAMTKTLLAEVTDDDDRELIAGQLATIPTPGPPG